MDVTDGHDNGYLICRRRKIMDPYISMVYGKMLAARGYDLKYTLLPTTIHLPRYAIILYLTFA